MSFEDDIRGLRSDISEAQARKVRAQMAMDTATARRDEAVKTLREHGIKSGEEAQKLIAQKEAELAEKVESIKAKLEEAGA